MTAGKEHPCAVYTEDELLRKPALFKYGPTVLWMLGLVLVALCYLGVQSNGISARTDAYAAALRQVLSSANATGQVFEHLDDRLSLLGRAVQAADAAGADVDDFVVDVANGSLPEPASALALVRPSGAVQVYRVASPFTDAAGHLAPLVAAANAGSDEQHLLGRAFKTDSATWLPFAKTIRLSTGQHTLIYLVDASALAKAWRGSLAHAPGWLRLTDASGQVLLEIVEADQKPGSDLVTNTAQGMSETSIWGANRWVAARALGPRGLEVQSAIPEASALADYHRRYSTVLWVVFGVAVLVMSFAVGTAHALKRFERKESYLRKLATVDILTELPNRRHFHTLLARATNMALGEGGSLGLLFVDLDNFKDVNDAYGHDAGDDLLKVAARTLRDVVGERGTVCRLGGDEFTVLLPDIGTREKAEVIGNEITRALQHAADLGALQVAPRASAGAALMPEQAHNASDLMRFADMALYQAKQNGRGCAVVYDEAMAEHELAQMHLTQELEQGVREHQLFLVYQPKFQMCTRAMSGFEALVRWEHPTRGVVSPAEFIPLAEKSGLIAEVGGAVLRQAVRQMRQWHDDGHGWHRVAVNVSPLQLRDASFVSFVCELLAEHGVPGQYLQLELTEGSLAKDPEKAKALVHGLRARGVAIAVDDFGTGYSSLGALQGFELDCLKIDRSFVMALDTTKGQEICRAVISFGHALGLRVIAEGVETVDQDVWLANERCDEVQGFHYSPPLSAREAMGMGWCGDLRAHQEPLTQPNDFPSYAAASQRPSALADFVAIES